MRNILSLLVVAYFAVSGAAQSIDARALLERETFWDNRDWDWYLEQVPAFDCPERDLVTTYYYRWELMTKHLTYGSPDTGYLFTEFIDRPFWSGAYGAISCPAGHQLYEARWLRSPRIAKDYSRYWFETPGAQPRNYSTWLADSVVAVDHVHPDPEWSRRLLPKLIENFEAWKARHYVESHRGEPVGLFWQNGHDDGMEFNIASRQTKDILRGAPSYRPSFNAYMWAEAVAIAELARREGDEATANKYQTFADGLRERIYEKLWDPKRQFFLIRYRDDEEKDGHKVTANSFIYEDGQFAGSPYGRELIGYVPWQFDMIPPGSQYDVAWSKLMDRDAFFADYGPSTVERNDPMFLLMKSCCWWSGQSWPYATTQTLKGLANHLQNGPSPVISADDYVKSLLIYARSHRKDGRPYLAEALHPDTGSFEGHDGYNHSEHYFHSGYIDLIITGLVGIDPSNLESLRLVPLFPDHWDYLALDGVRYRNRDISVLWDREGTRYGMGPGLHILCDGQRIWESKKLETVVVVDLPAPKKPLSSSNEENKGHVNHLVNNDGSYFPRIVASSTAEGTSISKIQDGNYWYTQHPPNRWASAPPSDSTTTIELDFGMPRAIDQLKLYFLDDEEKRVGSIRAPEAVRIAIWSNEAWKSIDIQSPVQWIGHRPSSIALNNASVSKIQLQIDAPKGYTVGLTEIEAWGPEELPYRVAPPPAGNLAYRAPGDEYPRTLASHSDRFGGTPEKANDGKTMFAPTPMNRWTSYESPSESDWLEIQFGKPVEFSRIELGIYDDRGGVQPPKSYAIEVYRDGNWQRVEREEHRPEKPAGSQWNESRFAPVRSDRVRIVFEHQLPAKSGVTEVMVWER
ncbi:MAG: discoidin domain-containing protein [Pirellula sp.]|nr:discoidin domain-containing protein [Pirellula sp.]